MSSSMRAEPTPSAEVPAREEEEPPCSPSSSNPKLVPAPPPLLHSPSSSSLPARGGEERKASMPFCQAGVGHERAMLPPSSSLLPFLLLPPPPPLGETADRTGASCFRGALAATAARWGEGRGCDVISKDKARRLRLTFPYGCVVCPCSNHPELKKDPKVRIVLLTCSQVLYQVLSNRYFGAKVSSG